MVRISFLTCVFLIGLRLVIGWHFFFEGVSKYESMQHEGSVNSKPFTSAGYFNEAEGPLGPAIRNYIGDEDAKAIAKLTQEKDAPDKMPAALAQEWDDYFVTFTAYYHLNDAEKQSAQEALDKDKSNYVNWLLGKKDAAKKDDSKKSKDATEAKKIKKKISVGAAVDYEVDENVLARVQEYKSAVEKVRDFYEHRLPTFGNVDKTYPALRALKSEAAGMRAELMKDVDEHTKKMKDDLAEVVKPKLAGYDFGKTDNAGIDDRVVQMVTLKEGKQGTTDASRMPEALEKQWDAYYAFLKEAGQEKLRTDPKRGDAILAEAKLRYVRHLNDLDPTGHPRPDKDVSERVAAYQAAIKDEKRLEDEYSKRDSFFANFYFIPAIANTKVERARLRQTFMDDIGNETEDMKKSLGGFKDDGYKGIAQTEKPKTVVLGHEFPATRLGWLDWLTRWMVLISGACLLAGLFTRLACLSCISFLVVEYLSNPPFPWLPVSPKSEGNYLFVNKNVIELFGLLVLVTLPTGRWLGLDAILSWFSPFGRRKRGGK
jgi:uncharacterized membrane protein YphA (DoxX/SURF4 family)